MLNFLNVPRAYKLSSHLAKLREHALRKRGWRGRRREGVTSCAKRKYFGLFLLNITFTRRRKRKRKEKISRSALHPRNTRATSSRNRSGAGIIHPRGSHCPACCQSTLHYSSRGPNLWVANCLGCNLEIRLIDSFSSSNARGWTVRLILSAFNRFFLFLSFFFLLAG